MMTKSIEQLRRDAKSLRRAYEAGDAEARQRIAQVAPREGALKHADYLHVIAREHGFAAWPRLVFAAETHGLDRAALRQRLVISLFHGQNWRVAQLLSATPDLADDDFHLACALYDLAYVETALAADPSLATTASADRRPIVWLATSRHIHAHPEAEADMLAIAELLLKHGADVNDGAPFGETHLLSAVYLAIGQGNNLVLGRWLLEHGANPNDGESLYHATELGHREGLKLLLEFGAEPKGTNALLRAMDFNDIEAVQLLLAAGADPDEFNDAEIAGEKPWVYPALHQAARRMCDVGMVRVLLDAGAYLDRRHEGVTAYALARAFGNQAVANELAAHGADTSLTKVEQAMADIADDTWTKGAFLDPAELAEPLRNIVRTILHLPGTLPHVERLVAAGVEYDLPDTEGLTPVQVAGWEGLPDVMAFLLRQMPDLSHVNGFGGTLLSTIIHGSENNPNRGGRDYIACLDLALTAGVALPRRSAQFAGDPSVAAFLADWAEAHPGQVVEHGVV